MAMPDTRPQRVQIEAVLGIFRLLDLDVVDADTIVATYQVPFELAEETLEHGQRLGLFGRVYGGSYELTPRGQRELEKLEFRGENRVLRSNEV